MLNRLVNKDQKILHLGVILCYNDGDLLAEILDYYLENCDQVIVYDHGSNDNTSTILDQYHEQLADRVFVPREFDFYSIYQLVSVDLINRWAHRCAWISWPDQDEFLEAPSRQLSYGAWVKGLIHSEDDWVEFKNFNFWFTAADDTSCKKVTDRIRHYSLFSDCAPRIRAWRASKTNLRVFNHNALPGKKSDMVGNLRHYPARSLQQLNDRLDKSRNAIQKGGSNYHYNNMAQNREGLMLPASALHHDDGVNELNHTEKFNWRQIYGYQALPKDSHTCRDSSWARNKAARAADLFDRAARRLRGQGPGEGAHTVEGW